MDALGATTATIEFKPDPGWSWKGWGGTLSLKVARSAFKADGNGIALASDIQMLGVKLAGKMYTAAGFDAIPGTCIMATVAVSQATLSKTVTLNSQKCVTAQTRGTFTLTCVPSFGLGTPPPPDTKPTKRGTWR